MKKEDFSFDLPDELIAKFPSSERTDCRLLHLDGSSGRIDDRRFDDILQLLHPGDLLVFNDTRVIPARLFGKKATGGAIEILIERIIDGQSVLSHVRASKAPKTGSLILLDDGTAVEVEGRQGALFLLRFKTEKSVVDVLDQLGHMPLPPYIDRSDEALDRERYQTVYSRNEGAVAAPTAGLHFDQPLLDRLREGGIQFAFVTLHVGSGTFQPVRVDDITSHEMHSEVMTVSQDVCDVIQRTKANGGRVIAVGTTSVRVLESASDDSGKLAPFQGETNIFIYPSYRFKVVDCLITNFHLPESTLIMLVSAFAGYHNTMQAYRHAVSQRYQFFSYGDAMFIEKNPESVTFERWRV